MHPYYVRHSESESKGLRLNADKAEIKRMRAGKPCGKKEIGKADVMDRELWIENAADCIPMKAGHIPGRLCRNQQHQ